MTTDADRNYVVVDTNVLAYLSRASALGTAYAALLAGRTMALPFQVRAELGGYPESKGWGSARQERLALLIEQCVELPHSPSSNTWYARVNEKRRELHNTAGDGDVWVLAQALEYDVPLVTHNHHLIELARAMGATVLTVPTRDAS